jgi:pimeloyl-ACP methyl ester carboxylesterase
MLSHESISKLCLVTPIALFIVFAFVLIIPGNAILLINNSNNYFGTTSNFAYGQQQPYQMNSNNTTNSLGIQSIPVKKVHVGDIDIAYKTFGKGDPILLINGYSQAIYNWDPTLLERLASNHTVIIFDNRGIGNTTSGEKGFSIAQFANDTASLLDVLEIKEADVLGFSMGGFIAQELALTHPDRVGKLIIYASICGGNESILPSQDIINTLSNGSGTAMERIERFLPLFFPEKWRNENPNYLERIPKTIETIPNKTLDQQTEAIFNWTGTCNKLKNISQPTLVIVGTEDVLTPPANSLLITERIPGAWLVQIKGAGHGLMYQYPEQFNKVLQTFLSTTTSSIDLVD